MRIALCFSILFICPVLVGDWYNRQPGVNSGCGGLNSLFTPSVKITAKYFHTSGVNTLAMSELFSSSCGEPVCGESTSKS